MPAPPYTNPDNHRVTVRRILFRLSAKLLIATIISNLTHNLLHKRIPIWTFPLAKSYP